MQRFIRKKARRWEIDRGNLKMGGHSFILRITDAIGLVILLTGILVATGNLFDTTSRTRKHHHLRGVERRSNDRLFHVRAKASA